LEIENERPGGYLPVCASDFKKTKANQIRKSGSMRGSDGAAQPPVAPYSTQIPTIFRHGFSAEFPKEPSLRSAEAGKILSCPTSPAS